MARQHRFWVALGAFVVLGVLEWFTLGAETIRVVRAPNGEPLLDVSVRGVVLAVLALFAFRSWIHHRREMLDQPQHAKDGLAGDPGDSERGRSGQQQ
jgi:hypothetical protein